MKVFIKNNIKLVIGIIIGAVISGVTVYASIAASNITYNNTTVDLALDDLYTKADKEILRELTLKMRTYSGTSQYDSQTNYMLFDTKLRQFYSYYMVTNVSCSNIGTHTTYGYNTLTSTSDVLTTNTEYSLTTYNNIWTILNSNSNGTDAYCDVYIKFYNK